MSNLPRRRANLALLKNRKALDDMTVPDTMTVLEMPRATFMHLP